MSASAFWHGGSADFSVQVVAGETTTYFSAISSTRLDAEVAPDARSGTIRFKRLAADRPASSDPAAGPELISGTFSWQCA